MTSSYLNQEQRKHRQGNWGTIFLMLIFLGVALASTNCRAQAVPSRNQSLIMTRPIVVPPEPPVEKEIRENRQMIQRARQDLNRIIQMEKSRSITALKQERVVNWGRLECFMSCLESWNWPPNAKCKDCPGFKLRSDEYQTLLGAAKLAASAWVRLNGDIKALTQYGQGTLITQSKYWIDLDSYMTQFDRYEGGNLQDLKQLIGKAVSIWLQIEKLRRTTLP